MAKNRDLPDAQDDAALFRAAIGEVTPLPATHAPPARPQPRPRARMRERDEREALDQFQRQLREGADVWEAGDVLRYRRDHVPPRVLNRLAQGRYAAQDELDLHGLDARIAEELLRRFIKEALAHGHGCVRIIHGKGRHSDSGVPMMKNLVDRVLRQRADVLAFHSAPATQGGTGAVLALLRAG